MADLFDIGFDDPAPVPVKPKWEAKPAPTPRLIPTTPCARRPWKNGHVCRVAGGDASFSDDGGRTWFCADHRPTGFFESDRHG